MGDGKPDFKKIIKYEGILIAIVPVAAYAFTWLFDLGFFVYLGIPLYLIKVELSNLAIGLGWTLIVGLVYFHFIRSQPTPLLIEIRGVPRYFQILFFFGSPGLLIIYLLSNKIYETPLFLFFIIVPAIIFFGSAFLIRSFLGFSLIIASKLFKGWGQDYIRHIEENATNIERIKTIISRVELFIFLLVLSLYISFTGGWFLAKAKEFYLIDINTEEKVILKIYGEKAICVSVDKENKIIKNDYSIVDISSSGEFRFRWEKLGHLKPEKRVFPPL